MGHSVINHQKIAEAIGRKIAKQYYSVYDIDWEDLRQEAMLVMFLTVENRTLQPETEAAYLRRTVQERLHRYMSRQVSPTRRPHDAYGNPLNLYFFGGLDPVVSNNQQLQDPPAAQTPPCHPRGDAPEGYDREDPLCHDCPDKPSCLVESSEAGLVQWEVQDDSEVNLLVQCVGTPRLALAYEIVTDRQRRRVRLRSVSAPIPPELAVTAPVVLPPAPASAPAPEAARDGSLGAPRPSETFPRPPGTPSPKRLSPGELEAALSRVKVGQPWPLEPGHVLVRRARKGHDVCVEIREDGFWLNLDGETYGSLSSAAKAAEIILGASPKINRPGNPYFSLLRSTRTEIRDAATGAVLAHKRGVQ